MSFGKLKREKYRVRIRETFWRSWSIIGHFFRLVRAQPISLLAHHRTHSTAVVSAPMTSMEVMQLVPSIFHCRKKADGVGWLLEVPNITAREPQNGHWSVTG
jgi:hypothetical protein